ncbi:TetR/AcrR family transcriptional regulator [Photobacterium sp. MCCC 1A19761]|uniref:TetR/AcrR family transcriptional regulator n=1 Tax=Photobacterium sp. MCCC 1A19761 TaxID=3115000 RepID=UPI00307E4BB3
MVKLAEIKQENILRAAVEIFQAKGLEQASMEAISKQAEVSKRTLYKYYPTKEDLFSAIVERLFANVISIHQIAFDPTQSVADQLTDFARQEVALVSSECFISLARVVCSESIRSQKYASLILQDVQQLENCKGLEKWIRGGIEAGKLNVDCPHIASEQFLSSLKCITFYPQLFAHQPPASEAEREIAITMAVKLFVNTYEKTD